MAGIKFVNNNETINTNGGFETKKIQVETDLEPLNAIIVGRPQLIVENKNGEVVAIIDKDTLYVSSKNYDKDREIMKLINNVNYTVGGIDAILLIEENIYKVQKLLSAIAKISKFHITISEEDKKKLLKVLEDEVNSLTKSEEEEYEIIIA